MTQYVGLDDYFASAAEQLGLDSLTVLRLSRVDLAESAMNAPRAESTGVKFYPTLPAKVAVLLSPWCAITRCPTATSGRRC